MMNKIFQFRNRLFVLWIVLFAIASTTSWAQQTQETFVLPCVFRVEVDDSDNIRLDQARLGIFNNVRWRVWAEFDISSLKGQNLIIGGAGFRVFNDWPGTQITSLRYTSIQPSLSSGFALNGQHTFANKYQGFSWAINPDDSWTPSEDDFFRPTIEDWENWKRDSANPGSPNNKSIIEDLQAHIDDPNKSWFAVQFDCFNCTNRANLRFPTDPTNPASIFIELITLCPSSSASDPDSVDSDCDGLTDVIETEIVGTDPLNPDTDGDGLLDSWEVDPSIPGAGFDLDSDGKPDSLTRDDVFGPYSNETAGSFSRSVLNYTGQLSLADKPDPLHKDIYLEIDWLDCNIGGCIRPPGNLGPPGILDPTHHAPHLDGLNDVKKLFEDAPVDNPDGSTGINLHILVDENLFHAPNCDQGRIADRSHFGTRAQRASSDIINAKELAFRYVMSIHSTLRDDPNTCPTPGFFESVVVGLGCAPLPDYDVTPFGNANVGGRDILVSLSPLWICPESLKSLGLLSLCFRFGFKCTFVFGQGIPIPLALPGIFPADIIVNGEIKTVRKPAHMLLVEGEQGPDLGMRQLWGRALMHLLGHSLGITDEAVVKNKPDDPGFPRPDSYSDWENLQYAPGNGALAPTESLPDIAGAGSLFPTAREVVFQDLDGDGVLDSEDNCPWIANPGQENIDGDNFGDACDADIDGDRLANEDDPFPLDLDNDGVDNSVDDDDDGDGVLDAVDNCSIVGNPNQADANGNGIGDACDADDDDDGWPDLLERITGSDSLNAASQPEFLGRDNVCADGIDNDLDGKIDEADEGCVDTDDDGVPNFVDNCPDIPNNISQDYDNDGIGDACDPDDDNDNVLDEVDLCPGTLPAGAVVDDNGCSQLQVDTDGDGICDPSAVSGGPSGCTGSDNCPTIANPDQADSDGDGIGDACEEMVAFNIGGRVLYCPTGGSIPNAALILSGGATDTLVTDANGEYILDNLPAGLDYTITPFKTDDIGPLSLTCFDAALTARIAVGLDTADHCDSLAADVNKDGTISTFDAALICRFAVGFPPFGSSDHTGEWLFEPDSISYEPLQSTQQAQDYVATLLGDVDGNWTPISSIAALAKRENKRITFVEEPQWSSDKKKVTTKLYFEKGTSALSFDLVLRYEPNALKFVKTTCPLDGWKIMANNTEEGLLRLGMYSTEGLTEAAEIVQIMWEVIEAEELSRITLDHALVNREVQTSVELELTPQDPIPTEFALSQNFPNPFNPETNIRFDIPKLTEEKVNVRVAIYNYLGQLVRVLIDEERAPGSYEIKWDSQNEFGQPVSSGVYFYKLTAGNFRATKKMLVLK